MITAVGKAMAQFVRYGSAEQTWFQQQEIIDPAQDNHKSKELDEETLRAMTGTAVKGSLGDDQIRFVFLMAADETSDIASPLEVRSKGRLVEVAGPYLAAAAKVGPETHTTAGGRIKKVRFKVPSWQKKEFEGNEEITAQEMAKLWTRIKPRRVNVVLQQACKCDVESCGNQQRQFKTTPHDGRVLQFARKQG